jgi:hypothetical protein
MISKVLLEDYLFEVFSLKFKFHYYDLTGNKLFVFKYKDYNTMYYNYEENIWIVGSILFKYVKDRLDADFSNKHFTVWSRKKKLERIKI